MYMCSAVTWHVRTFGSSASGKKGCFVFNLAQPKLIVLYFVISFENYLLGAFATTYCTHPTHFRETLKKLSVQH